jgi:hypothetical protein
MLFGPTLQGKPEGHGLEKWDWALYPDIELFLNERVRWFLTNNHFASTFISLVEKSTSTRAVDWIDHMRIPTGILGVDQFLKLGFSETGRQVDGATVLEVKGSAFFPILSSTGKSVELAISVEDLDAFRAALESKGMPVPSAVQGERFAPLRRLDLNDEGFFLLSAVERRGGSGYRVDDTADIELYTEALRALTVRERNFETDGEGLRSLERLVKGHIGGLDRSRVADAFFRAERDYWLGRSRAGRVQKTRQDGLGLGWGNCDHHTFRSSRANFPRLIRIFEMMGITPRERFYAGTQAGWGAQIFEQPDCRSVVFSDVDLGADERDIDFGRQELPERKTLGTVGLWVSLNGESLLQAGMHHLAARFNFDGVREDLAKSGVGMMKPFSSFPFLKQAFTEVELWRVDRTRAEALERDGQVSKENLTRFLENGAIGSHLEDIERNQGFKGFNQDSVSAIIGWTDPRKQGNRAA